MNITIDNMHIHCACLECGWIFSVPLGKKVYLIPLSCYGCNASIVELEPLLKEYLRTFELLTVAKQAIEHWNRLQKMAKSAQGNCLDAA